MQMGHAHDNVKELVEVIHAAEAVVVGAGSGLSTAAGLTYDGERFRRHFSDFIEARGFTSTSLTITGISERLAKIGRAHV